jgi:N-acetylmuramoyl-L-alanine amidase
VTVSAPSASSRTDSWKVDATPRANSTVTQNDSVLSIKFDADALDTDTPPLGAQPPQSLVAGVRVLDATTLAVDLGSRAAGFRATSTPVGETMRLTIDVPPAASEAAPAPPPAAPAADPGGDVANGLRSLGRLASAIETIAIDPGHGGDDTGVRAAGGAMEKDLTLAVARRLKAAIEGRLGIRVLLTRDDDRNLPPDVRTAVANNNKADLFISLHANASFRPASAGATIYYAAFDAAAIASAQAPVEQVPTFSGGLRDLELVAWDLAQTHHLDQSMAFAAILEERLRDRVPLAAQPIESAPLGVLEPANMPAVLIEMGFLSNAEQERLLASGQFQNTFVQGVTEAVIRFRDSLQGADR